VAGSINKLSDNGRAWVEIDLNALSLNVADIRSNTPENCELMAVIKADAYGHGVEKVAKRLVSDGVRAFAVATVVEGAELRGYVPAGDILVMGYTHPMDAGLLHEYNLSQLAVDGEHAKALDAAGNKLRIHIAVDTGMHRLGIEPFDFDEIEGIFKCENLTVEATATHLASPDSFDETDINFTNTQMDRFYSLVNKLKEKGYNTGKLHAQSSYGIYNYPELRMDYIRPGIMLYGVKSRDDDTKVKAKLTPMLSLRAVIAQVRWIKAGESVSYGRLYTAEKPIKLATVGIGYADGIPRQMSNNGGMCIVNGCKVPIIGRICMDMLMLDVTNAGDVRAGDIATFIGRDGNERIHCEEVAAAAGTITNDILCRLGTRLPRVYVE
jgi:serine/alanine racemase